jgi:trimeric autotransporter adhesin
MNSPIQLKPATSPVLTALALLCLGLFPQAQAVVPPPDGGYPNFTTAEGINALKNLTTGFGNTGLGWYSLFSDTTGSANTAVGTGALVLNNSDSNTAIGAAALLLNTGGGLNTAVGVSALQNNTEASRNTAIGSAALFSNITGEFNTAIGDSALASNTQGEGNIATGGSALSSNTEGNYNTATGYRALLRNTTGTLNTANGKDALFNNTEGQNNTAAGFSALFNNTAGSANTAVGRDALHQNTTGTLNTAIGFGALDSNTSGSNNLAVGVSAGANVTTASGVICIYNAGDNINNSCYIGNIWNQPGGTQAVYVNGQGKLGAQVSSQRFKDEIKPMDHASEVIYSLKPVSFRYKPEIEPARPLGFGLIAEDVAQVNSDLVMHDQNGEPYTVHYDAINAMLLNEFLKEHKTVQALKATVAQQQEAMEILTAQLKEQATQIQKVSAQVEIRQAVGQTALNNP